MDNVLETYETEKRVRPTFLTVLCILTFIGSGWGLINNSIAMTHAEQQAAEMQKASDQMHAKNKGDEFSEKIMSTLTTTFTPENIRKSSTGGVASAVLCLLGAFLMWRLRKTGYYIYIVGALIGIATPFVVFGTNNFLAIGISAFFGFFGLLFIILYGLNLKSMR